MTTLRIGAPPAVKPACQLRAERRAALTNIANAAMSAAYLLLAAAALYVIPLAFWSSPS